MTIASGTKLGRYEIRSKIGEGGMGEVYRAYDEAMHREVAIKVLPAALSADKDRLARFEQEAQTAGSLNHPNILVIHHIETHEGAPYIVSELLEGQTLRERMGGVALPQRKALDYALQVAQGLAAAHDKGIVHRDLKPENIFITKDGRVKILDFGIAKLTQADGSQSQTDIPTRRVDTGPGVVMGTVGYMSPEQVRGKPADHRSDIFSFGAILYEMLSGKRAFRGESTADTISAILREDPPDLSTTNRNVNPALERVVNHCLEKNPEERFNSARDLAFAIEALTDSSSGRTMAASLPLSAERPKHRERLVWIASVSILSLALLAMTILYLRRPQAESYSARFSVPLPENVTGTISLALSPDGRRVAFVASTTEGKASIYVRPIDSLAAQKLAGTEEALNLFWSPDSRSIGFFAGGKLKKIEATGGPPQTLCDAPNARGGTWNRDGVIVFSPVPRATLYRVPASGGVPVQITKADVSRGETSHRWPVFLPDGRHFLYFAQSTQPENNGTYVGALDSNDRKLLFATESSAQYAPPGYLLFIREKTLMAQPFDASRLQLTGEPVPIAEQVRFEQAGVNSWLSYFSVSENGALVYTTADNNRHYVWFDRSGKELGAVNPAGDVKDMRLSPDGKRAAIQITINAINADIWLVDLERNTPTRFTFSPAVEDDPVWSPDGSRLLFTSERGGLKDIYQKLSSGAGSEELLLKSDTRKETQDWSSDGRYVLFEIIDPKTHGDLWVLPLFGDKQPFPFLATEFSEFQGRFSPDGRWISYVSNASGKPEVYVQSFPASGGIHQISTGGGTQPVWRHDGRELFYIDPDRKLMSVELKPGVTFEAGVPRMLFETRVDAFAANNRYGASPDGQRFLINVPVETQSSSAITVVLNWTADLKR